ncbi:hypothetical protein [Methyloceanibacter methanicus]|uniref:hypothetical protein n=1 Tax=Methyloceanibacter methanicus TaxID=1774968 RepID=UPI00114CE956|nr:hypothetical protein [Methyloceanibacter methanicus]
MKKNVVLAAAAAALIAGATLASPVQAASTCAEMAKAKASNIKERVQMKRECKKSMKSAKAEGGKLSKLNFLKDRS